MTTAIAEPTDTAPVHSEQEKRQAMVVYASVSGRREHVERMLAEVGLGHINYSTLRSWVYRDRKDEYLQIKGELDGYVRSEQADHYRNVAALGRDVSEEALRQLQAALEDGQITFRDLPKVAREAMVTAGIATDKGELLSGNPTSVVKTDLEDVTRELAVFGIHVILPGASQQAEAQRPASPPALPAGD
ncbi:MAG TPA: hypothetical protein VF009_07015 [Solirubrobacterales bacterium]